MEIEVSQVGRFTVAAPDGDLEEGSRTKLQRTLEALIAKGNTRLVVDLRHVAYIDSAVWGDLAAAATRGRAAGGDLRLCAMSGELLTILTMTRLSSVVAVFPTRDAAVVFEEKPAEEPSRDLRAGSPFRRAASAVTNVQQE